MSNRIRLTPPPQVQVYASAYRCHDCTAEVGRPTLDADGVWHITIAHDEWCPVLTGRVNPRAAGVEAAEAAAATGHRVLYIGEGP